MPGVMSMMFDEIWLRKVARNTARRVFPAKVELLDLDEVVRRIEDGGYTDFRDVTVDVLEAAIRETIENTARDSR